MDEKYTERNVLVTVKNKQNMDGEDSEIELTCEGYFEYSPEGSMLYYTEATDLGFGDTDTTVEVKGDVLTITRTGGNTTYLYLKKGEMYLSSYNTPFGKLSIGIRTKKLEYDLNEGGGLIEAVYTMDVPPDAITENSVTITIKPL